MCFQKAKWKREVVQDHKFDFVCIEDFKKDSIIIRLNYLYLYLIIIKTILVYIADLWTAGILIILHRWSSSISPQFSFHPKWIYLGCISISFILLALEWRKARAIIASRDISYAFTSIIAFRYFSLKSYPHYCFFYKINKQKKRADKLAFFVFFSFKGWKRLLFAEAPRQVISAFTLFYYYQKDVTKDWLVLSSYQNDTVEKLAMALMAFTLLVFVVSAVKLIFAFIIYIPLLLFHIRGNLKEYCCHKIDKRIDELLKKHSLKRRKQQRKIEQAAVKGDKKNIKKKNQTVLDKSRRSPTLPTLLDNHHNNNSNSNLSKAENLPPPEYMTNSNSSPLDQIMRMVRPPPYEQPRFNHQMPPRQPHLNTPYNIGFHPQPPQPPIEFTHNLGYPVQSVSANTPMAATPHAFYYTPPSPSRNPVQRANYQPPSRTRNVARPAPQDNRRR